ncbi:MAG: hypothetical protein K2J77_09615 [Oscillospiraceae bacterium]|nr:hypothetical protein [Oscillospiraceae bacterium]
MDNKRVDAARIVLKCLGVVAAVFALIGSIGCLVSVAKINSLGNLSSSAAAGLQALNAIMSLVRDYDFARVGALILLGFASILAVLDKASGSAERGISIFTNTMAALGLVAVVSTSLWLTYLLAYEEQMKYFRNWKRDGYAYSSASFGQFVNILYTVAMIIIMLAAISMIISLIYSIYRIITLKTAARSYANQQYAQQYQQPYPQQGYPQQQYPQYPGHDQNNNTNV